MVLHDNIGASTQNAQSFRGNKVAEDDNLDNEESDIANYAHDQRAFDHILLILAFRNAALRRHDKQGPGLSFGRGTLLSASSIPSRQLQ